MADIDTLHRALCCGSVCGGLGSTGACSAETYGAGIQRRAMAAGFLVLSIQDHDRRITELLQANNIEVERRRAAEASASALRTRVEMLEAALQEAVAYHEAEDDMLSKQPPSGHTSWRRMQHQEQRDAARAALENSEHEEPAR